LLLWSLAFIVRYRVLRGESVSPVQKGATQRSFIWSALVPAILSAILLAELLGSDPFSRMFEKLGDLGCDAVEGTSGAIDKNKGVRIADVEPATNATEPQLKSTGDFKKR
jgi:hypothetical protein